MFQRGQHAVEGVGQLAHFVGRILGRAQAVIAQRHHPLRHVAHGQNGAGDPVLQPRRDQQSQCQAGHQHGGQDGQVGAQPAGQVVALLHIDGAYGFAVVAEVAEHAQRLGLEAHTLRAGRCRQFALHRRIAQVAGVAPAVAAVDGGGHDVGGGLQLRQVFGCHLGVVELHCSGATLAHDAGQRHQFGGGARAGFAQIVVQQGAAGTGKGADIGRQHQQEQLVAYRAQTDGIAHSFLPSILQATTSRRVPVAGSGQSAPPI